MRNSAVGPTRWVLVLVGLLAGGLHPGAAAADPVDIESFVKCVNKELKDKKAATVVDTVKCVPNGCFVTLSMEMRSAQKACFGHPNQPKIQLPRVVFDCPGPGDGDHELRFFPSYVLCPTGFAKQLHHVELAEHAQEMIGALKMADIEIAPNQPFQPLDVAGAFSQAGGTGSKRCNECHRPARPAGVRDGGVITVKIDGQPIQLQLSAPFPVGGVFLDDPSSLAQFIIFNNRPPIQDLDDFEGRSYVNQSLAGVCAEIEKKESQKILKERFKDQDTAILTALCKALAAKASNHGAH